MSTAEDSIRGQLEAAVKAQHAEPPEVETDVESIDTSAESVETLAKDVAADGRTRDEKGRFAAKEAPQPDEPADKEVAEKADPAKPAVAKQQDDGFIRYAGNDKLEVKPQADQPLAPPNGFSAEAKAKWHETPLEVMAAIQQRERDIASFTSKRDEHASFGKEVYQIAQPYQAQIQAHGATIQTALQSALYTMNVLYGGTPEVKARAVESIIRDFKIDTSLLGLSRAAKPNGAQPTNTSPEFAALQNEVAELRGLLRQRDEAVNQQLQSETQTEIEAFAADPKHPHFPEVKAHMAALLREGTAKNLQDAYDQATWARPDTRATLLAQQRAEEEQKRKSEAKQKAEAAKRKNVSITGGPGNTAAGAAPGSRSLRDELLAAQAELTGSV